MSQPAFDDFLPLFEEANQRYLHGDLVGALALATEGQERFPAESAPLYYLRATLKARMGDTAGALELLTESIDKGYWYPDGRWSSDAFSALQDSPEFIRQRTLSNVREAKALAEAKPELTVEVPPTSPKAGGNGATDQSARPLVIALHGSGYGIRHDVAYWTAATRHGWLLGMAQSAQVIGYDAYAWSDYAAAERELVSHYDTLRQDHPVDTTRVVIAGKSQGAETAIRLALSGMIPARGFIAVVPSGPMMLRATEWDTLIQNANRDLRGYVLLGGREAHFAASGRRLIEMLRAKGIACAMDFHPAVRHEYPVNFRARLSFMLDFVMGTHDDNGKTKG